MNSKSIRVAVLAWYRELACYQAALVRMESMVAADALARMESVVGVNGPVNKMQSAKQELLTD